MRSKIVRVAIYSILVILGIGIVRSVYTISQKKGILTEREQVLSRLTTKNKELQQELKEATSPAFIERSARDNLGLVRPGETVVIMDQSNQFASGQKNPQNLPSWKQWWQLFF